MHTQGGRQACKKVGRRERERGGGGGGGDHFLVRNTLPHASATDKTLFIVLSYTQYPVPVNSLYIPSRSGNNAKTV